MQPSEPSSCSPLAFCTMPAMQQDPYRYTLVTIVIEAECLCIENFQCFSLCHCLLKPCLLQILLNFHSIFMTVKCLCFKKIGRANMTATSCIYLLSMHIGTSKQPNLLLRMLLGDCMIVVFAVNINLDWVYRAAISNCQCKSSMTCLNSIKKL